MLDTKQNWRNADTCVSTRKTDWLPIHWRPTGTRNYGRSARLRKEQRREQDRKILADEQRSATLALAEDLPRLWKDPEIEDRDRKRMIRLLIEDVTLIRGDQISLHLRFRGGACKSVTLPNPLRAWEIGVTDAEVVTRIDHLLDTMTFGTIAATLNGEGYSQDAA